MAFGPTVTEKEQQHKYLVLKGAKGVNTQPSREALAQDEYLWLENIMPIGGAFNQVVPQRNTAIATVTGTISTMRDAVLGTTHYQICFTSGGGAQAVNIVNSAVTTICAAGTFSTGVLDMDQWKSERIVIIDPVNGFYSWDGTLFSAPGSVATISVTVTGSGYTTTPTVTFTGGTAGTDATAVATLSSGGVSAISITHGGAGYTTAPTIGFTGGGGSGTTASAFIMPNGMVGQSIAVYSGRVWTGNNRTLSYTAPNTWYDVNIANAAGSTTITEASLKLRIYALEALNNYLYVFGDSSILIIGDLKVSGASTTFSTTFLSSTTGTTLIETITALERAIIFCNQEGVHALVGASLQKISKPLDGIFPDIDFTAMVTAGLAVIYNIKCYALNFHYTGDLNGEDNNRKLQAVYFDGKWFLTFQGAVTLISSTTVNGVTQLWGTTGSDVSQLYTDQSSDIDSMMITGLYDLGNAIFDKQLIRAGLQVTSQALATFQIQMDTESNSQLSALSTATEAQWVNNLNSVVTWQNNALTTIPWIPNGFTTLNDYYDLTGKYLGATIEASTPGAIIHGILMEYVHRASWSR